jgi:hypothetical protein
MPPARLERATDGFEVRRSLPLSYGGTNPILSSAAHEVKSGHIPNRWVHTPFVRRGTALLCPSSRRLSPVPAGEVRRGDPPHNPFFSLFPCPVKYVRFHRAGLARPQSKHVPSRESREKAWSQDFLEGRPHPASPAERGRGLARPPHSQESFCMTNHACTLSARVIAVYLALSYNDRLRLFRL